MALPAKRQRPQKSIVQVGNQKIEQGMALKTFKILLFLKRRPGMTMEEFRDYYENIHARLAEKYANGLSRYMRRYLQPMPDPVTGKTEELPFDVVTELWFEEEGIFRSTVEYMSISSMPEEVVEDEKKLFDRTKIKFATVIEFESDLSRGGAGAPD